MPEQRTLLAVVDPTATSHPAMERATALARATRARLELFVCEYDPQLVENAFVSVEALAKARAALIDKRLRWLRELAKTVTDLDVGVDARWDSPRADGIVRKALDSSADVVFKDTHYHALLKRSVFSNTDWNLIRECPALLWLTKPRALASPPHFIAAVDPLHEHAKPTELDDRIISAAKRYCYPLNGELHVLHAFDVNPALAVSMDSTRASGLPPIVLSYEITEAMRIRHTDAVRALTDAHGLPADRVHVQEGAARAAVLGLTEQLHADVVVMGAVSRRGLKRLFLGNTAEDVLDSLPCDLLIVKPAGFETGVPR